MFKRFDKIVKKLLKLYIFLIIFLNYKKKDEDVLKINSYFRVSWSFFDKLDERIFKNDIFKYFRLINIFKIINHIFLLHIYTLYLLFEYFLMINFRYKFIYELNLWLYWCFDNKYIFFKWYNFKLIINKSKNYFINKYNNLFIKKEPKAVKKNIVYKYFYKKKQKLKLYFLRKYNKRYFYWSYIKIIINRIVKKLKYVKFYYFTYYRWKWYFFVKYHKILKIYSRIFIFLMDKKLIFHYNFLYEYYNNFYKNIIFYKIFILRKFDYKYIHIKKSIKLFINKYI